ncbi:MAG: GTPase Era [Eggerthellaceae bacterium]|nr:GTPase Era [Eggerthellaceae bacterium]
MSAEEQTAAKDQTLAPVHHSGFVTLVGRPNAGKSSLLNALLGKKVAITSDTAQTTRHRFRAVLTREDYQLVVVDTPGLHKPHDTLGQELNTTALKSLDGVDVVAMLIDASKEVGTGDEWVAAQLERVQANKVAVLSKIDLVDEEALEKQLDAVRALAPWDSIIALSALTGDNLDTFLETVVAFLPEGPRWFPQDMETDQPLEVLVAEFIREKVLQNFYDEIPHAIGVLTEEMDYDQKKDIYRIFANIFVERESQKGMIIGKGGSAIKEIGTKARLDLEQLLECKVFLELRVKVRKNWRRDLNQIQRFGYGESRD